MYMYQHPQFGVVSETLLSSFTTVARIQVWACIYVRMCKSHLSQGIRTHDKYLLYRVKDTEEESTVNTKATSTMLFSQQSLCSEQSVLIWVGQHQGMRLPTTELASSTVESNSSKDGTNLGEAVVLSSALSTITAKLAVSGQFVTICHQLEAFPTHQHLCTGGGRPHVRDIDSPLM